ncbi:MAG: virulence factor [Pseudomonadota bacterium]
MPRIGHNSGGNKSVYAIVFDLDTQILAEVYEGNSPNNAYADIRRYLTTRGFEWMQGSTYFGDETINAVNCVTTVQRMSKKFDWFSPAVRDIRMLRIEENNDMAIALVDDEDA